MSTDGSLEAFERDQKGSFGQFLRERIHERRVQFIAEEARYGEETIAQRVCRQEGCGYANVDMTAEERKQRRIPSGYYEGPELSEAEKARCNREREEHMSNRALTEAGQAESVLVICGRLHTDPIPTRLVRLGHCVEKVDLRDEDWYIEDWFGHMLEM